MKLFTKLTIPFFLLSFISSVFSQTSPIVKVTLQNPPAPDVVVDIDARYLENCPAFSIYNLKEAITVTSKDKENCVVNPLKNELKSFSTSLDKTINDLQNAIKNPDVNSAVSKELQTILDNFKNAVKPITSLITEATDDINSEKFSEVNNIITQIKTLSGNAITYAAKAIKNISIPKNSCPPNCQGTGPSLPSLYEN
jgi:gas vesicle protein